MFIRQERLDRISKTDLMLELNIEIRRIEKISQTVKAIKISYLEKGSISVFLSDKSDANELLNGYKDRLIKAVKVVNMLIIGVEIVIKWYKVKLVGMFLIRYLLYGGMELF